MGNNLETFANLAQCREFIILYRCGNGCS